MNDKQAEFATKLAELFRDYNASITSENDSALIRVRVDNEEVIADVDEITFGSINCDLRNAGLPEVSVQDIAR